MNANAEVFDSSFPPPIGLKANEVYSDFLNGTFWKAGFSSDFYYGSLTFYSDYFSNRTLALCLDEVSFSYFGAVSSSSYVKSTLENSDVLATLSSTFDSSIIVRAFWTFFGSIFGKTYLKLTSDTG